MSSKYCPFLIDRGGFLTTNYECRSSGKSFTGADDLYRTYCSEQFNYPKCPYFKTEKDENEGCYLTSACVEAMGLADDCEELTILRGFRDNWLYKQPEGSEEIEHYYETAPKVVAAVRKSGREKEVFEALYRELVMPCCKAIKDLHFGEAHDLYRKRTLELEKEYL